MKTTLEAPNRAENSHDLEWLTSIRDKAATQYDLLPMPTARAEAWRFASVNNLSIEQFEKKNGVETKDAESFTERSRLISERAGRVVFVDDQLIRHDSVSTDLAEQGVIYLPIEEAIREHPELMERYFLKEVTELGSEKFFWLHAREVSAVVVLFIPKGVTVEKPFVNYHWTQEDKTAVFPHTLVIAEDNAQVSLVDVFMSDCADNNALNVSVSNIHAHAGAHVFRKVVQDWNEKTTSFQLDTTVAERNAQVKNLAVNLGAKRARFESQTRIEGPGADVKMYSLTVAEDHQEFDQRTHQTHNAPHSVSDLLYKNALLDSSRTIFSGLIKVAEGAQETDAYQTNRNLLLDPQADANALPGLEILANDVRCSHGATTGNVDKGELFYLMQRGIPLRTAMQLMVSGFFEEVIEKVDSDELAENLRDLIHEKFTAKIK